MRLTDEQLKQIIKEEKRSKYPSCRPTPGACKEKGKGKSWGKKAKKGKNNDTNRSKIKTTNH